MGIQRIDSYFDIPALQLEHEKYKALVREDKAEILSLYEAIKSYKGSDISNIATNTNKLSAAMKGADKASANLAKSQGAQAKASIAASKAAMADAKAQEADAKARIANERAIQQQIKTEQAEQRQLERSNREKEKAIKLAKDNAAIPFTTNLSIDGTIVEPARGTSNIPGRGAGVPISNLGTGFTQQKKQLDETAKSIAEYKKAISETNVEIQGYKLQTNEANKAAKEQAAAQLGIVTPAAKAEAKAQAALLDPLKQLSIAYEEAAHAAQLSIYARGKDHPISQQLIADANLLDTQLKDLDSSIGKNQKRVGDYAGGIVTGFQKVFSYVRQAAYIIPGLGIAGIFDALIDGTTALVKAMISSNAEFEKAALRADRINQAYLKLIGSSKELNDLLNKQSTLEVTSLEKTLLQAQQEGKAKAELLLIEKQLAEQRAKQAKVNVNQAPTFRDLFDEDGQKKLNRYTAALKDATEYYNGFIEKQSTAFGIDKLSDERYAVREAQLKNEVDVAKSRYNMQLDLVQEYNTSDQELLKKNLEINTYFAEEERKLALFTAQSKADNVRSKNQLILNDERSTQAQIIAAIKGTAEQEKALAIATRKDVTNNPGSSKNDRIIAKQKEADDIAKINLESAENERRINEQFRRRDLEAQAGINEAKLALQESYNNQTLARENASLDEKLQAFDNNLVIQLRREDERYVLEKDRKGLTDKEIERLEQEHQKNLTIIAAEGSIDRAKLTTEELLKAAELAGVAIDTQSIQEQTADYGALLQQLKLGIITVEQFTAAKEKLDKSYSNQSLKNQIDTLEKERAIELAAANDITEIDNKVAQLEQQLRQNEIADVQKTEEAKYDIKKQYADRERELINETINLATQLGISRFTNELNELQAYQDERNAFYVTEQKNLENSSASEEAKTQGSIRLRNEQEANDKVIEQRRREIQKRQAQFERATALAQIALKTFVAVGEIKLQAAILASNPLTLPLAAFALAQIPLAIAVGAIQAAAILATPLPTFAKGGLARKGTTALTDEKGPELYIKGNGDMYMGNGVPTVRSFGDDTTIIPADKVDQYLYNNMLRQTGQQLMKNRDYQGNGSAKLVEAIYWQTGRIENALNKNKKKTVVHNHINLGWMDYKQKKTFN